MTEHTTGTASVRIAAPATNHVRETSIAQDPTVVEAADRVLAAPVSDRDREAAAEAVALAVLDGVTAVVVTTVGPSGVERTRRAVYLTLAGAERAVEAAHVRGHRATAVVVRLVPLGVAR